MLRTPLCKRGSDQAASSAFPNAFACGEAAEPGFGAAWCSVCVAAGPRFLRGEGPAPLGFAVEAVASAAFLTQCGFTSLEWLMPYLLLGGWFSVACQFSTVPLAVRRGLGLAFFSADWAAFLLAFFRWASIAHLG